MVPSEEVEEPVGEEHRHLVEDADAALLRLFPRGRDADNDVSEDAPGEPGELALSHREREHVGRAIFMTIDFVQLVDALVVG